MGSLYRSFDFSRMKRVYDLFYDVYKFVRMELGTSGVTLLLCSYPATSAFLNYL